MDYVKYISTDIYCITVYFIYTSLSIAMVRTMMHESVKRSQLHMWTWFPDVSGAKTPQHLRQYVYLIDVHSQTWTSWWLNHPSQKYESIWIISPIFGVKIKNIWNHQPVDLLYLFFSDPFVYLEWLFQKNSRWAVVPAMIGIHAMRDHGARMSLVWKNTQGIFWHKKTPENYSRFMWITHCPLVSNWYLKPDQRSQQKKRSGWFPSLPGGHVKTLHPVELTLVPLCW